MLQTEHLNTRDAARALGVSVSKLSRAVWEGRVDSPPRGPGNSFLWSKESIERASWQLNGKGLGD
jgi:hypothetical protein